MASIILYNTDAKYIHRTIDEIIDKTPKSLIDEILVCDDSGLNQIFDDAETLSSKQIGRAKVWNLATKQAKGEELIFLGGPTKLSHDWLPPLLKAVRHEQQLATPIVHTLDLNLWASENNRWSRFGWRWDMDLYNRAFFEIVESPTVSSYCFAVSKEWFDALGGFDDGMQGGYGEDIELSLRSWLFGGRVVACDSSLVSCALRTDVGPHTAKNLVRIVEAWMPKYSSHFYEARGLDRNALNAGRIDNLLRMQHKQKKSIEWFFGSLQPELMGVYPFKGIAAGKTVAIVGTGPSIDLVNPAWINRHDIVIGVDYMGSLFDCDYIMANAAHVVVELRKSYADEKFVVPISLENRMAGQFSPAMDIVPGAIQYEQAPVGNMVSRLGPPFCNFENSLHAAVHFALYLGPAEISLFGCDNKIIDGRSHSAKIEYYDDGRLWSDSEAIRKKFAFFEFGLDQLGRLALANKIPLIRVSHA